MAAGQGVLVSAAVARRRQHRQSGPAHWEDCREFVEVLLTKVLDFLISLIGLASFVTLLWQLSTFPLSFELFGIAFEIPLHGLGSADLLGNCHRADHATPARQMPGLLAEQQKREADFRFALMRLRENAAAIALSGGEQSERRVLDHRFQALVGNWRKVISREFIYGLFQRPYFQTVPRIPMFLALPAFLAGNNARRSDAGSVGLSEHGDDAVVVRFQLQIRFRSGGDDKTNSAILGEIDGVDRLERPLNRTRSSDGVLRMHDVSIFTPDKRPCFAFPSLPSTKTIRSGSSGASGLGKEYAAEGACRIVDLGEGRIELSRRASASCRSRCTCRWLSLPLPPIPWNRTAWRPAPSKACCARRARAPA
jgi:putative ATP-binding cassette transporter